MQTLNRILDELSEIKMLKAKLNNKGVSVRVSGLSDNSKAHMISALSENFKHRLVITHNEMCVKALVDDYKLFDKGVMTYVAKDLMFYQADIRGNELTCNRMKVLSKIAEKESLTVVTTFDALMSSMAPLGVFLDNTIYIDKETILDEKAIAKKLVSIGYEKNYQVEKPGQFSIRGGIIDIFEITEVNPFRIELWGDDIESIRSFDVLSQRSIEELSSIKIFPASEIILTDEQLKKGLDKLSDDAAIISNKFRNEFKTQEAHRLEMNIKQLKEEALEFNNLTNLDGYINYFYDNTVSLLDLFDEDNTLVFIDEPMRVNEHANAVETEFRENMTHRLEHGYIIPEQMNNLKPLSVVAHKMASRKIVFLEQLKLHSDLVDTYLNPASDIEMNVKPIMSYNSSFEGLLKDLEKYKKNEYRVLLLSGSRTRAERLSKDLQDNGLNAFYTEDSHRELKLREIETYYGHVSKGYEYPALKLAVISESDIFGAEKKNKKRKKRYEGQQIQDFNELNVGDYVVHEYHGLGIYRGIEQLTIDEIRKDYLKIEYREGGTLYVLATGLGVLQKYASADAKTPKLNKLGSQEWNKTKEKVRLATEEVAKDLVKLYATRQEIKGYAYGPDTVWQKEFEELFPFEETEDQLTAIEATKNDMESTKIMDRLICGDVGFGKTEIAIRAAFKAVQEGKQVVYLVPTTILAQQHYDTFKSRMKDFPVRIDLLSRFRTAAEIRNSIKDLKKGFVDIIIGTHRVLSKDVEFKDLGLLIIDEEQRFGVTHKEKIKQIKESVDVLTLTATPIPRTLHMSLIGIRDMSVLEEAPNDRQPIQTYVMEYDEEMVREAIVREMARGGQVYYVYNRVNNIDEITSSLQGLVPEARIAFAHGQMAEKELEYIMYQFINHEIDVLVSTTIIETGMDISNVNTMIIHDSDKLGLSQLYQLRGRVGRSNRTAYAFLMYKKDRLLREEAEKRLSAIKEFTDLGSGFKIAMKDLEIRGAGNLLGRTQHGHMQAVGYDLYCKMLNEAVKNLKGIEVSEGFDTLVDLEVDAFIPSEYIVNEIQKLDIYKRIAGIENMDEYNDIREELLDRFGKVPKSAENLLKISLIRVKAHSLYITEIRGKDGKISFTVKRDAKLNPDGVLELFKKYKKLTFSNKTYQFIHPYTKTGLIEKDERTLLSQVEELLDAMELKLLNSMEPN